MTMKIKQEDGTEIEVYTAQELEEQKQAAVEEAKKEVETIKATLAEKEAALKAAEEGGNDQQKERLRKERDEAKAAADDAQKKVDEVLKKVDTLEQNLTRDEKDKLLNTLSKGDKDTREKIELHYDKTLAAMPSGTSEERRARMAAAVQLATGNKPMPGALDTFTGMGGDRGDTPVYPIGGPETEGSKGVRKALNIKDEDVKKYEGRSSIK